MAVLTTAIFGTSVWLDYFTLAAPFQNLVLQHGSGLMLVMMPTVFINARLVGLPLDIAWTLQALMSGAAIAATVWTFRCRRDPLLSTAMLLVSLLLVTPYAFNYDMAALTVILVKLRERADPAGNWLILALWLMPITMMLDFLPKVPGSALVPLGLGIWLFSELRKEAAAHSAVSASVSASTVSITRTSASGS
jgi:alpha-1,2-mannosyltransferase